MKNRKQKERDEEQKKKGKEKWNHQKKYKEPK